MKLSRRKEIGVIKNAILDLISEERIKNEPSQETVSELMDLWKNYSAEEDKIGMVEPAKEERYGDYLWHKATKGCVIGSSSSNINISSQITTGEFLELLAKAIQSITKNKGAEK